MVKPLGIVIAVLLLLLGISGGVIKYQYHQLVKAEAAVKAWESQDAINRAEYAKEMARAVAEVKAKEERHAREIASTVADLEAAKRQRDSERLAAGRLRLPTSVCEAAPSAGPRSAGAPAESDVRASIGLPEKVEQDLRRLAQDADDTADQLRAAQAVIRACYAAQDPSRVPAP